MLIGACRVPEVLNAIRKREKVVIQTKVDRVVPRFREVFKHRWIILRSSVIGIIIGIIPGVGSDTASWLSYFTAKRDSKHPELFGKGSIEGLVAAETGDNACIGGDIIPTITLAVPGSAPAAVLLAALTIHNLRPGPMLVAEQPHVVGQIIAISMLSTIAVFGLSLLWVRQMVRLLLIPRNVLMPAVLIICVTGAYALSGRLFDIYVMFGFGLVGVLLQELEYPIAPFVLGFSSRAHRRKNNARRALMITAGDPSPFFTRPISLVLFGLLVLSVVGPTSVGKSIKARVLAFRSRKT